MVWPAVEAGFRRCLEWDERSPFGSATGRVPEEGRGISWGRSRPRLDLPVIPGVLVVPLARMGPRTLARLIFTTNHKWRSRDFLGCGPVEYCEDGAK